MNGVRSQENARKFEEKQTAFHKNQSRLDSLRNIADVKNVSMSFFSLGRNYKFEDNISKIAPKIEFC